jgi:hypothetical protein
MVIQLFDEAPVFGIVLEVQLAVDQRKEFVWPVYVANLRARLECPVCLLVVTADEATARWARRPIDLGGLQTFTPYVLGPSVVPCVLDESIARANPELAVLSAIAHGRDQDSALSVQIATLAGNVAVNLDSEKSTLYFDLIINSLSEAARFALKSMSVQNYEYQSDYARHYVAQGRKEGRVDIVTQQLARKFGLGATDVRQRIAACSVAELEAIAHRVLTATTLDEAIGA